MNDESARFAEFGRKWTFLIAPITGGLFLTLDDRSDPLMWFLAVISVGVLIKWPYYATLAEGHRRRDSIDSTGANPPDFSASYRRLRPWEPVFRWMIPGLIAFGILALLAHSPGR